MIILDASGQIFSIAMVVAWMASGSNWGFKLLKPAGNKFVSTGEILKPEFLKSTEA